MSTAVTAPAIEAPARTGPGRAAIIGAGGGIGWACVSAFAQAGWAVTAADIDGAAAQETIATASPPAIGDHTALALDSTDPVAVGKMADAAEGIDAVVYCAGIAATMPIAQTDFAIWRKVMAVNLDGAAIVASAFARSMIARDRGGAMVFVSSAAGQRGEANASAYCASKFGLIGLVQSIAAELTAHRIRVNAVAPGNVDTPMLRDVAHSIAALGEDDVDRVWQALSTAGAARRLIEPAEVAHVCLALCSPGFSGVTGATLPVDGGYLLSP
ncbi:MULTISPECIES: SDR family oxidoreductase [unclassified Roseitalea]|uniref:SDR family NAD(P)-dependent oxidoreductase n=1 Tax=unclassified Roseitalea TaxID=2639107 RepID=UPI00273F3E7D|nr:MULTISPECIES: SDR family oxidoreductase [unclassified Roseitalea]